MANRTFLLVFFCTVINSLCILTAPSAIATPVDDFFNVMQELESVLGKGEQGHKYCGKSIATLSEDPRSYTQPDPCTPWNKPKKKGKLIDTGRCSIP